MKKYFLLTLVILLSFPLLSQEMYHRVRVDLVGKDIHELGDLGVEVDHGHMAIGRFLENDFSEKEIKLIQEAGFKTEILIEDMGTYYREQMGAGLNRIMMSCEEGETFTNIETPTNFTLGSMGGFYTYQELLDILDDMHEKFPDLITEKSAIGTFLTHEGREIYSLSISDNPGVDEGEPSSLYTAIHHAREPNSLTQMIYFMWYVLENYETDPLVKNLLDNTALHFIPCINPDGYVFNEEINPDGGGLWRKNRRDNGNGTFGVDLNRNYGFEWGIDDQGSSSDPASDVYRGPEPFSEPETQAVKYYCEQNNFTMALNYHTYGNLLIHPWGYNDSPTPEDVFFKAVATEMVKYNSYVYGTGTETVGYTVNGDSDDWMYGEEGTKNKIYSMTPEVGVEGFWPPIDRIVFNCQANIHANIVNAAVLLNLPIITDKSIELIDEFTAELQYKVMQLGFDQDDFEVEVSVLSGNASVASNLKLFQLDQLEEASETITVDIDEDIEFGEEVVLLIESSDIGAVLSDTMVLVNNFGGILETYAEDMIGDGEIWLPDGEQWFYGTDKFVSAEYSLTDSPNENYATNINKSIKSKVVSLPDEDFISLSYDLFVGIEDNYDYAIIYIEKVGSPRVPLCGKFSEIGVGGQPKEPLYDGSFGWVKEEIDISAWAGMDVQFSIRLGSDTYVEDEGIYIDNWNVSVLKKPVHTNEQHIQTFSVYPNPADSRVKIALPFQTIKSSIVYNSMGERVLFSGAEIDELDVSQLISGFYVVVVQDKDGNYYKSQLVIK